mgnify:CR=1 FL=1
MTKKCPEGKILRVAYTTKKGTHVPETCVKDMGLRGKGKKILPKPDDGIHLKKFGYKYDLPTKQRRSALLGACKKYGTLMVLRSLNLKRNIQAHGSEARKIMREDVKYLKIVYEKEKKNQRGGQEIDQQENINENIDEPVDDFVTNEPIEEINHTTINEMFIVGEDTFFLRNMTEEDSFAIFELTQKLPKKMLLSSEAEDMFINYTERDKLAYTLWKNEELIGYCLLTEIIGNPFQDTKQYESGIFIDELHCIVEYRYIFISMLLKILKEMNFMNVFIEINIHNTDHNRSKISDYLLSGFTIEDYKKEIKKLQMSMLG